MSLYSDFKKEILRNGLVTAQDDLLLGLSGGLDSVVLLHLLMRLQKEFKFSLRIAHVNYHLREHDSNRDQELVSHLAKSFSLPLNVKEVNSAPRSDLQNWAREIRYKYFGSIARKYRCNKIVLAHHAQDQVETFLMRMLRGAGLQGLKAMEPRRVYAGVNMEMIRPLLKFKKEQLKQYAHSEKIRWREDTSNQKTDYLRNFIRLKILKNLQKVNPQAIEKILQAIEILQDENQWMDEEASRLLGVHLKKRRGQFSISVLFLQKTPKVLRARIYLKIFEQIKEKISFTYPHIQALDDLVMNRKSRMKLSFSQGWGAAIAKDELTFRRWRRQKLNQRGFFC